ncbi:methyltransferase FkbM [Pseudomonas fulva]|uniref:methyltransferase FkbM n=1 Tax=Pseudomonas fulva TaxID=47880 RepID=UPI0024812352|nr:methyltransferase FkbM [Pseudomonas fulva]
MGMSILSAILNWLGLNKMKPSTGMHATCKDETSGAGQAHAAQLVPYDENLLELTRMHWQSGDWVSLAKLQRETLQHHPDRERLALLAAGGHQQLGNMSAARELARLAQDWGCSRKLISQVLIAGMHNTLGRASAIAGRSHEALGHFEKAVDMAAPSEDGRSPVEKRIQGELAQFGVTGLKTFEPLLSNNRAPSSGEIAVQQLSEEFQKQHQVLSEQIRQQNVEMTKLRQSLERTVKSEMLNATQQLEAFMGVQNFMNYGERLPGMHGWPISPDFALYLIELIDRNDYDLILEFGSGTSTVIIAKTLARIARHEQGKDATVQVAFEHLEKYYLETRENLERVGMGDRVRLKFAPPKDFIASNGITYPYYSCKATLSDLNEQLTVSKLNVLMLVDGPPASFGKHARYPAVPLVLANFKGAHIDVLLDDYIREDEKEIAQLWMKDIENAGLRVQMSTRKMEKDACLISISQKV